MPADFLTDEQYQSYAKYPAKDKEFIDPCRRDPNKLGYAIQLTTLRFLGTLRKHWEDILRVTVSLKLGYVSASDYDLELA